jgi:Glu-tRNA(Gln) amidotransferase subunit E-like FAD-binding protein
MSFTLLLIISFATLSNSEGLYGMTNETNVAEEEPKQKEQSDSSSIKAKIIALKKANSVEEEDKLSKELCDDIFKTSKNGKLDKSDVPGLIELLTSTNDTELKWVCSAIGLYGKGAESALPHLKQLIKDRSEDQKLASKSFITHARLAIIRIETGDINATYPPK